MSFEESLLDSVLGVGTIAREDERDPVSYCLVHHDELFKSIEITLLGFLYELRFFQWSALH